MQAKQYICFNTFRIKGEYCSSIFDYNVGVLRPPVCTQNAQFYAPTEASKKEF